MQLVAVGAQDAFISGNAEITFFKVVYRRHTNFAIESIEQTYNYGSKSNQLQLLGYVVGNLLVFLFDEKNFASLLSLHHQNTVASKYVKSYLRHCQSAGTPLEPLIPKLYGNIHLAKKKLGYGNNSKDWAISSQALNIKLKSTVQRLNGNGGLLINP